MLKYKINLKLIFVLENWTKYDNASLYKFKDEKYWICQKKFNKYMNTRYV